MTVLYVILLAAAQGILEFLPVSSFGHLCILQNLFGMDRGPGVLLEAMLHFGTLAAVIVTFRKDIVRIGLESIEMAADLVGNLSLSIHNHKTGEKLRYAKIISTPYKKFALLIWVSMIPSVLLGYTARRLVALAASSRLLPGAGILITGIVLLVVDFSRAGGKKAARDTDYGNAMWIGICQGLSVFPGLSRSGLTISAGLMGGLTRNFAVKYSYILSVPTIIGAFFLELGEFASPDMTLGLGFTYVLGMAVAGVTGYFVCRTMLRILNNIRFRYFAYYCFLIGFAALIGNYVL